MMEAHRILGKAGEDGRVHFDLNLGIPDREYELIVVVQPKLSDETPPMLTQAEWADFIESTAGSIQDETFRRHEPAGFDERPES